MLRPRWAGAIVSCTVLFAAYVGTPAHAAFLPLPRTEPTDLQVDDLGQVEPPPGSTTSVVVGFGDVWVTYFRRRSFIARIDGKTGRLLDKIPVPWIPSWETGGGAMTTAYGALWIAGIDVPPGGHYERDGQAALFRVDPSSDGVTTFDLGGRSAIDVTSDGASLIVAALIRRRPTSRAELLRVDPSTGQAERIARVDAPWERTVLAVSGSVWLSERRTHGPVVCCPTIVPVVPAPGTSPVPASLGGSFAEPVSDGASIWAATGPDPNVVNLSSRLVRIDPLTGALTGSWNLHTSIGYDMEFGNGCIWAITSRHGHALVERFDPSVGDVTGWAKIHGTPTAIASGNGAMWLLTYDGHLLRIHAT